MQRSLNGLDFKSIGNVQAIGNSSVVQNYSFEDADVHSKTIYYRLKIVEINGSFKYSKILIFKIDKGITTNSISPNPFMESIKLDFETNHSQNIRIKMYDLMGRQVKTINLIAHKGTNTVNINELQNLPAGSYIIEMIAGGERVFKEILLKK